MAATRILYVYDKPDWAIHQVGEYWSSLVAPLYDFTFVRSSDFAWRMADGTDVIFWGYSRLPWPETSPWRRALQDVSFRLGRRLPMPPPSLTVVHDPCDVFPQKADWKVHAATVQHLRSFARVAVTSREMLQCLSDAGIRPFLLNTTSQLRPREMAGTFDLEDLKVFTRCHDYPRKNLRLWRSLEQSVGDHCERFDGYIGGPLLSVDEYVALIDSHNCYVCTSWQEGGPIPVMDAVRRGCAVVTRPVGQVEDWVQHGYNGFICDSDAEFRDALLMLAQDPELLRTMRQHSLDVARRDRTATIRQQLESFLALPALGVATSAQAPTGL